jgi:hypothetical protein
VDVELTVDENTKYLYLMKGMFFSVLLGPDKNRTLPNRVGMDHKKHILRK